MGVPLDALIERFEQLRGEQLARLRELVGDDDLDPGAQISAALAGSYDAAVGPWKAYLGILLRRDAT